MHQGCGVKEGGQDEKTTGSPGSSLLSTKSRKGRRWDGMGWMIPEVLGVPTHPLNIPGSNANSVLFLIRHK